MRLSEKLAEQMLLWCSGEKKEIFLLKNDAVMQHKSGAVTRMRLSEKLAEQMLLWCSGEKKEKITNSAVAQTKKVALTQHCQFVVHRISANYRV